MEGTSQSHLSWARSLEFVLSDRPALDAFQEWLKEYSSPQYLDLHFAIRAYERMVIECNPKRTELARTIYAKFISSRSGICGLIPSKYRAPIAEKIRFATSTGKDCDSQIFQQCSSFVDDFLRKQHEQFVCSDEFINAFNKISLSEQQNLHMNTMERRKSNGWRKNADKHATQLTAETLLKSRHDRQVKLGEIKLEKMYPPTRQPYVCNATTSHNDSAVSSSFSGETPSAHRTNRLRHLKEEQTRENPVTSTVPRVENSHKTEGQQFDHSSEQGRKYFGMVLCRKLFRILDKITLNDEMEKKINDIEQCKYTTLDMLYGTNTDEDLGKIDEEEEIDDYLKKMKDDSQRASATRSPKINIQRAFSPPRETNSSSKVLDRMAQSMVSFSTTSPFNRKMDYNQFSLDTFTPPPTSLNQTFHGFSTKRNRDGSQMYDSSGIGSMAPSAFSESTDSSRDRRSHHSNQRAHHHNHHISKTGTIGGVTPRKHKNRMNFANLITISYIGSDGVPVVAHVPDSGTITLKEFKDHFVLGNSSHPQLFFRTECEDNSAPYQLLLIKDENHALPVFEGRITAELR